ncbi:MAG: exonuclease SbcCD subunit D C-terminal domain-containing protein [Planctomycetaceae bacterium]|nr:exonuclease SbcCD subunit D C-terminal domain-containing protein [Planctomycetaceae bacterium]
MLTVFHTADWHLGQSFFGFDRDYEHQQFLEWLLKTLDQHRPDALIISGDVFDTVNPSALAQRRYYDFLATVSTSLPAMQIVITAGNHDSAARLESPSSLLESLNIRVVGTVSRNENDEIDIHKFLVPIVSPTGITQAIVLAIPFLRPSDVPLLLEAEDPYLDGVKELYRRTTDAAVVMAERIGEQVGGQIPIIAMGHCHVMGGIESRDSERRIVIGGSEAVSPGMFPAEIAYVALGHLHKAQQFRQNRIRYCGSPLPLSFAESGYQHSLCRVCFEGCRVSTVEEIPVPRTIPLLSVPAKGAVPVDGLVDELATLTLENDLPPERYPFLELRILDQGPDPSRRVRIEDAVENLPVRLASIKLETMARSASFDEEMLASGLADLHSINPEEILTNAFREKYQADPDQALLQAFREIVMQQETAEA